MNIFTQFYKDFYNITGWPYVSSICLMTPKEKKEQNTYNLRELEDGQQLK